MLREAETSQIRARITALGRGSLPLAVLRTTFGGVPTLAEVAVGRRFGGRGLSLVLGAQLLAAIGSLHGAAHLVEADLPDLHAEVQGDGQVGDVGQLEREVAPPARVHVP